MSIDRIRCRGCGEHVDGEIAQIDALQSAASRSSGELRTVYHATAANMLDRLAEALRVRRLAQEHLEGDLARKAGG